MEGFFINLLNTVYHSQKWLAFYRVRVVSYAVYSVTAFNIKLMCGKKTHGHTSHVGMVLQGKSYLWIPFLGIARRHSQFPHSCVCERFLFIPRIGPHISCRGIGRSIMGMYKSFADTWMWKLGLWPRNSFSGNICFQFLELVLWNVESENPYFETWVTLLLRFSLIDFLRYTIWTEWSNKWICSLTDWTQTSTVLWYTPV